MCGLVTFSFEALCSFNGNVCWESDVHSAFVGESGEAQRTAFLHVCVAGGKSSGRDRGIFHSTLKSEAETLNVAGVPAVGVSVTCLNFPTAPFFQVKACTWEGLVHVTLPPSLSWRFPLLSLRISPWTVTGNNVLPPPSFSVWSTSRLPKHSTELSAMPEVTVSHMQRTGRTLDLSQQD